MAGPFSPTFRIPLGGLGAAVGFAVLAIAGLRACSPDQTTPAVTVTEAPAQPSAAPVEAQAPDAAPSAPAAKAPVVPAPIPPKPRLRPAAPVHHTAPPPRTAKAVQRSAPAPPVIPAPAPPFPRLHDFLAGLLVRS